MYAIILAGGYAKRLWPLTQGTPKALLPIAGKPILDYIVEKLQALNPPPSRIILSTNMLFQPQFEGWLAARSYRNVEFFPDVSSCENDKPGAIKAMADIVEKLPDEDVLVIAGDGMFNDNLATMLETFRAKNESTVALYEVASLQDAKRCATVKAAQDGKIIEFTEKPAEPKTKMVCGAVYLFKKGINRQLKTYLASKLPADQPGRFVEWLCRKEPVYGYMLSDPLWDIGTHEAYRACDEYFVNSNLLKE
ncbi:MAG: nucleotidyltransferase family protein [Candidatus Bathyarchaeota archaeon]|nr:nucleotidyltransferase family protein [Candidatus Bathyarchaeota archaeon]